MIYFLISSFPQSDMCYPSVCKGWSPLCSVFKKVLWIGHRSQPSFAPLGLIRFNVILAFSFHTSSLSIIFEIATLISLLMLLMRARICANSSTTPSGSVVVPLFNCHSIPSSRLFVPNLVIKSHNLEVCDG